MIVTERNTDEADIRSTFPFPISTFPWFNREDDSANGPWGPVSPGGSYPRPPGGGPQSPPRTPTDHVTRRTTVSDITKQDGSFESNHFYPPADDGRQHTEVTDHADHTDSPDSVNSDGGDVTSSEVDEASKSNSANDRVRQYFEEQINETGIERQTNLTNNTPDEDVVVAVVEPADIDDVETGEQIIEKDLGVDDEGYNNKNKTIAARQVEKKDADNLGRNLVQ